MSDVVSQISVTTAESSNSLPDRPTIAALAFRPTVWGQAIQCGVQSHQGGHEREQGEHANKRVREADVRFGPSPAPPAGTQRLQWPQWF